jgi:hypothetical protein
VDEVENLPRWRIEKSDARVDYALALRDRNWFEIAKARKDQRRLTLSDGRRMREELVAAKCRFYELEKAGAPARALYDALAAVVLLDAKLRIASKKYRNQKPRKGYVILRGMQIPVGRQKPKRSPNVEA